MPVCSCPQCGTRQEVPAAWPDDDAVPSVVCYNCGKHFDPFENLEQMEEQEHYHATMTTASKPWTLLLGSCCAIPVRAHYSLFALVFLQSIAGMMQGGTAFGLWNFLLYGPILFGTVLVHELGHCAAARCVGGHAEEILLWPLGGLAYVAHSSGHCDDMKVAIAGPLTHIPMGLGWLGLQAATGRVAFMESNAVDLSDSTAFWHSLSTAAVVMQVSLFAFNLLLPAYPLDGGRVFADALLLCGMEPNKAAKITAGIAIVISLGIGTLGVLQMLGGDPFGLLTVLVAAWVMYNSYRLYEASQQGTAQYHPMFSKDVEAL